MIRAPAHVAQALQPPLSREVADTAYYLIDFDGPGFAVGSSRLRFGPTSSRRPVIEIPGPFMVQKNAV